MSRHSVIPLLSTQTALVSLFSPRLLGVECFKQLEAAALSLSIPSLRLYFSFYSFLPKIMLKRLCCFTHVVSYTNVIYEIACENHAFKLCFVKVVLI